MSVARTPLLIVGLVTVVVGLVIALAAHPSLGGPVGLMLDATAWPMDGSPGAPATPTERLMTGIAGGLMVGWGASLVLVGRGSPVRRATRLGGAAWFAVDSAASIAAEMPLNIVVNVVFLALIVWGTTQGDAD
jgi:hypothetical protein